MVLLSVGTEHAMRFQSEENVQPCREHSPENWCKVVKSEFNLYTDGSEKLCSNISSSGRQRRKKEKNTQRENDTNGETVLKCYHWLCRHLKTLPAKFSGTTFSRCWKNAIKFISNSSRRVGPGRQIVATWNALSPQPIRTKSQEFGFYFNGERAKYPIHRVVTEWHIEWIRSLTFHDRVLTGEWATQ